MCICSTTYTGPTCSIIIDPCLSQPCIANNTISCDSSNNVTFRCSCRAGFTG